MFQRVLALSPVLAGLFLLAAPAARAESGDTGKAVSLPPAFDNRLLLGAHRGGVHEWPENTLTAFRECAAKFPQALLEGDLHCTADGEVVVIHDSTVDRTTDGEGLVAEMTLEELQQLDAAYHFTPDGGATYPWRGKGVVVPTLREVLAALPDSVFLMEMKHGADIAAKTVAVIEELGYEDRVILASVNPLYMAEVAQLNPRIPTCFTPPTAMVLLTTLREGDWENYTPPSAMLTLSPTLERRFTITPDEIRALQAKGIAYQLFTLNTESALREALEKGVDSILTDRPTLLARLIAEHQAANSE